MRSFAGSGSRSARYWLTAWLGVFAFQAQAVLAQSQFSNWRTYTNLREINRSITHSGQIWSATTGGVLRFDPGEQRFSALTNVDGLATNNITALTAAADGMIWIGTREGEIHTLNPDNGAIKLMFRFEGRDKSIIHDLFAVEDIIYIGLGFGVGEFRIARNELKEVYRQLGTNASFREIQAQRIQVMDGGLFIATPEGVAATRLELPNLKAPDSWKTFTTASGLPSNQISDFAVFDGQLLAATRAGIAMRESESTWRVISAGLPAQPVVALAVAANGNQPVLYAATATGVFFTSDLAFWQALPSPQTQINDLVTAGSELWLASSSKGLFEFKFDENSWQNHQPDGPKDSRLTGVTVGPDGVLWGVSTIAGFLSFDGQRWNNFEHLGELATGDYRAAVVADDGLVWLASWGRGVIVLDPADGGAVVDLINADDDRLSSSVTGGAPFVVINDLTKDRDGTIWISNKGAKTGRAIAAVTPDGRWAYFSTSAGLISDRTSRLIVDQFNRLWYGTDEVGRDGLAVIDYGGTLFDPTDDRLNLRPAATSQLASPVITGLAEDGDGTVWIGTPEGLNFWFANQISRQFRLISNDIRVVRVDPANNKWIGTSSGVSVLFADNFTLTHLTTENSPLVSNSIGDFAFDPRSGDVYIATTNGLSVVSTPFTAPKSDFSTLRGYPNPFFLDGSSTQFTVTNLVRGSGVSIFTEAGQLVFSVPPGAIQGGQVTWDGRDQDGEYVASGIYVYVAHTEDGRRSAGKIAVIRK